MQTTTPRKSIGGFEKRSGEFVGRNGGFNTRTGITQEFSSSCSFSQSANRNENRGLRANDERSTDEEETVVKQFSHSQSRLFTFGHDVSDCSTAQMTSQRHDIAYQSDRQVSTSSGEIVAQRESSLDTSYEFAFGGGSNSSSSGSVERARDVEETESQATDEFSQAQTRLDFSSLEPPRACDTTEFQRQHDEAALIDRID